jgi:DNA gyrase inhibitor GyrI
MGSSRYLREEYLARINRVIDYIESNMEGELSLGKLAWVASFSLYLNDPNEHPEHKHIVDIYVPVKPL